MFVLYTTYKHGIDGKRENNHASSSETSSLQWAVLSFTLLTLQINLIIIIIIINFQPE